MVQRLENKIYAAKTNQEPVIDFEKNENLKGLEHIEYIISGYYKEMRRRTLLSIVSRQEVPIRFIFILII